MQLKHLPIALMTAMPANDGDDPRCKSVKLYEKSPMPIGVAINTEKLKYEEAYWTTAITEFNSFTPEKILKPQYIHPKRGRFDFHEADRLMEFCAARNIRLHGHALLWHRAMPGWMERFKGSAEECESLMKEHIAGVMTHCKGRVKSWDVVNEAFNDDGSLRNTVWLKHLGAAYIEKAFRHAREADPGAKLFYNDYGIERPGPKLDAMLAMLDDLDRKGVRIDGVGFQMHVSLTHPTNGEIAAAVRQVAQRGYLVHYSELDVNLSEGTELFASRKKLFHEQGQRVKEIVMGYLAIPPGQRFGITLWGVSDNDSWLSEQHFRARPTLFDHKYRAKPAYCGFVEAIGDKGR